MPAQTSTSETAPSPVAVEPARHLDTLPVTVAVGVLAVAYALARTQPALQLPLLVPFLNAIFVFIGSGLVAYLAAGSYLAGGSTTILLLGSGALSLGLGVFLTGWLSGWPVANTTAGVHDVAFLLAAALHATGPLLGAWVGLPVPRPRRRLLYLAVYYAGVPLLLLAAAGMMAAGWLPPLMLASGQPTALREAVLAATCALFTLSAVYFLIRAVTKPAGFLYWYALALALLAVHVLGTLGQRAEATPAGWVSGIALYVAGAYLLVAVVQAGHAAQAQGIVIGEALAEMFRVSHVYWHDVLATMRDAIISTDEQGRIVQWNEAAERLFGHPQGEVLGRLLPEVLPGTKGVAGPGEETPEGIVELQLERRDHSLLEGEVSVSAQELPVGRVVTFIIRDVTERKRAEERLLAAERARAQLAEHLTAEIGHRTKNNLTIIAGLLQMQAADRGQVDSDLVYDAIRRIHAFGALHQQLYETHTDEVDLVQLLRRIAQADQGSLAAGDLQITVEGEGGRYPAKAGTNLCVVANELLTNAVKHGGPVGGTRQVKVEVAHAQGELRICVWNSGNPVAADFDPAAAGSTGMTLVRGIAARYAGSFTLQPAGGGSLAELRLDEGLVKAEA